MYVCVYIYIYIYIHIGRSCSSQSRVGVGLRGLKEARQALAFYWVFRDVVLQDVGFQTTMVKTPHPYKL